MHLDGPPPIPHPTTHPTPDGTDRYGVYTTAMRVLVPDDDALSFQLLFGYVGALALLTLLPVALVLAAAAPKVFAGFTPTVFGFIVVNGLCDNVLSDYLWVRALLCGGDENDWCVYCMDTIYYPPSHEHNNPFYIKQARSIVLTSPTVATVGLSLTIPLAFLSDAVMGKLKGGAGEVLGALAVAGGFFLVSWNRKGEVEQGEREEAEGRKAAGREGGGVVDGGGSDEGEEWSVEG